MTSKPGHGKRNRRQMTLVDDSRGQPKTSTTTAGPSNLKKPRASRSEPDPEKSKALRNMPEFARAELDESTGSIIATLVHFFGLQAWPWELDYNDRLRGQPPNDVFWWLFHKIMDHLFAEKHYTAQSKSDQIYQKARLGVSNVRARMGRTAIQYVKLRMDKKPAEDIRKEVKEALRADRGELYWSSVDTEKPEAFSSPCVLIVLAEHLKMVDRSILGELDIANDPVITRLNLVSKGLPEGALTMSICAAHRAFLAYESGSYQAPPPFSGDELRNGNARRLGIWRAHAKSVRVNLMEGRKTRRFHALVDKANEFIDQQENTWDQKTDDEEDYGGAAVIHVPSSPVDWDDDD
ncbi:hypothetical protein BC629DRAFT_1480626 [Irpex lacteus]|nr:hypothetical protein BC629DRAFT_1480626 [Irpex lacteus]